MPKAILVSLVLVSARVWAVEPETAAPQAKAPDTSAPALAPKDDAPPRVKLLTNGEAPRERARLALKVGDVQSIVMDMGMGMKMSMDGAERSTPPMPTIGMNMVLTVEDATPDGRWTYRCELVSLDVKSTDKTPPEMLTLMKAAMSELVGMKFGAQVDELGRQREFEIVTKITNPMLFQHLESMKQSMAQMSVSLPEEEIGIGAKWEVEAAFLAGGISTRQTSTYHLVARSGPSIKLNVSTTQAAAAKNEPIQNLPAGVTGTLVGLAGSGRGEIEMELTRLMPARAHMAGESVANMNMESRGVKIQMDTHANMEMSIRPATPADDDPVPPKP